MAVVFIFRVDFMWLALAAELLPDANNLSHCISCNNDLMFSADQVVILHVLKRILWAVISRPKGRL